MKTKRDKIMVLLTVVMAACVLGIVLYTTFMNTPKTEVTTYSMGSYVQQTVYGKTGEDAAAQAANAVAQLEDLISWRKPDSDIAKLNAQAGGNWVELNLPVAHLLSTALDVAEKSGGALDPTIAPLSQLWDFDNSPTAPPKAADIEKFKEYVNYKTLKQDGYSALLQKSGYAVDLGALGKGAACDEAVAVYRDKQAAGAIISVGGSVGIYGKKPGADTWEVAVRDPAGQGALGSLRLTEGFLSTSGNYEKFFTYDGKNYHHLLDPATGYPAESGLVSVTVFCNEGGLSDALSTACFVLGYEKSLPLLEQYGAEALFVDTRQHIKLTAGLQGKFTLAAEGYTIE